jgi:hypothetical protein
VSTASRKVSISAGRKGTFLSAILDIDHTSRNKYESLCRRIAKFAALFELCGVFGKPRSHRLTRMYDSGAIFHSGQHRPDERVRRQ